MHVAKKLMKYFQLMLKYIFLPILLKLKAAVSRVFHCAWLLILLLSDMHKRLHGSKYNLEISTRFNIDVKILYR